MRWRHRRELLRKGAISFFSPVAIYYFSCCHNIFIFQVEKTEGEGKKEAVEKAGRSKEGKQWEWKLIRWRWGCRRSRKQQFWEENGQKGGPWSRAAAEENQIWTNCSQLYCWNLNSSCDPICPMSNSVNLIFREVLVMGSCDDQFSYMDRCRIPERYIQCDFTSLHPQS